MCGVGKLVALKCECAAELVTVMIKLQKVVPTELTLSEDSHREVLSHHCPKHVRELNSTHLLRTTAAVLRLGLYDQSTAF